MSLFYFLRGTLTCLVIFLGSSGISLSSYLLTGLQDNQLLNTEPQTFGFGRMFYDTQWSPDSSQIAINTSSGVWLLDVHHLEMHPRRVDDTSQPVTSMAFSSDGQLLAIAEGSLISVIDLHTFSRLARFATDVQRPVVRFNTDNDDEVVVYGNFNIQTWDIRQQLMLTEIEIPYPEPQEIRVFSADRSIFALITQPEISFWDTNTGRKFASYVIPDYQPAAMPEAYVPQFGTFSSRSSYFAYGRNDMNLLILWQPENGDFIKLEGHNKPISSLNFSPDEQLLISTSQDNTIRLWETATGKQLNVLTGFMPPTLELASVSPNNAAYAWFSGDYTLHLWDIDDMLQGVPTAQLDSNMVFLPGGSITSISLTDDPWKLASSTPTSVRIWNEDSELPEIESEIGIQPSEQVEVAALSSDGEMIALGIYQRIDASISPYATVNVEVRGAATGETIAHFQINCQLTSTTALGDTFIHFIPEQPVMAMICQDGVYRLNVNEQTIEKIIEWNYDSIDGLDFSPDVNHIVIEADSRVRIWSLQTGELVEELFQYAGNNMPIAIANEGTWVAFCSGSGINIWDRQSKYITQLSSDPCTALAFSSLDVLATGGESVLQIWNNASGWNSTNLEFTSGSLDQVIFSPMGNALAALGQDSVIRVWNISTVEQ